MHARILAIGTALPERSITQEDSCTIALGLHRLSGDQARRLTVMYHRTHVAHRGSVLLGTQSQPVHPHAFLSPPTDECPRGPTTAARMQYFRNCAGPMAKTACADAIALSGVDAAEITHLITVSCTGFAAPGVDQHVIATLGLSHSVERTNIGFMGCHAAMNALRVAGAIAQADANAVVMLICVELCTLHFQYVAEPDQMIANALFADGAAAAIVTRNSMPGKGGMNATLVATVSQLLPESAADMDWSVGDHGFCMGLSARVPEVIATSLRPWMTAWLEKHGLRIEDIASWAIHPGGPKIIQATGEALGIAPAMTEASRGILREHGNMSSATVLFIAKRLAEQQGRKAFPCVLIAFGPGLTAEAALLT